MARLCAFTSIIFHLFAFTSWVHNKEVTEDIETVFSELGFSPSCVASSLSTCENNAKIRQVVDSIYGHLKDIKTILGDRIKPHNCAEIFDRGDRKSGLRLIYPFKCCDNWAVPVYCDHDTDQGGWTIIQHREDYPQRENFYRTWMEYKLGFGNLSGEFWLGLDNIHALASSSLMELRVDLEDYEGEHRFAKYNHFYISDESDKFRWNIGEYSGDAGDGLYAPHNNKQFSTKDNDNDEYKKSCSKLYKGAWWYKSCHSANLNGLPHKGKHDSNADGINWSPFKGYRYSLRKVSLSLRPRFRANILQRDQD